MPLNVYHAEIDRQRTRYAVAHFQPERPAVRLAVEGIVNKGRQCADLVQVIGVGDEVDQQRRRILALFRLAGVRRLAAADDHQTVDRVVEFKVAAARVRQTHEQLLVVAGGVEHHIRHVGHRVDRLAGVELREHLCFIGRRADAQVQNALFGKAYAVVAVGRERHVGQRHFFKIALHVAHTGFLGGTKNRAQRVFALHTVFLEDAQAVEIEQRRALVVGDPPAVEPAVALGQRIRNDAPVIACGHYVHMRQHTAELASVAELHMHALVRHHLVVQSEVLRTLDDKRQRAFALLVALAVNGFNFQKCRQVL